jgi:hypothetical protein
MSKSGSRSDVVKPNLGPAFASAADGRAAASRQRAARAGVVTRRARGAPGGVGALRLAVVVLALLGAPGCDASFEPIAETDRTLSVFGHLDASADTQWIRVLPLRPLIFTSAESTGVSVVLEALRSGRTLPLRDSVFEYSYAPSLGADVVAVHNYWTAERIEPGETYRFRATGPDGASTTAEVAIPLDYAATVVVGTRPVTVGNPATSPRLDRVRVAGVEHVAFVKAIHLIRNSCRRLILTVPFRIPEGSSDPHAVPVNRTAPVVDPVEGCGAQITEKSDLFIVGSKSPWPIGEEFSAGAQGVPDLPTNLTNGFGFVGGVLTKLLPFEDCSWVGQAPLPATCELTYGPEKATLTGTITEPCGHQPLPDATVRLETLRPDPVTPRRVRTAPSGLFGAYRVAGLDPGERYALTVRHQVQAFPSTPRYLVHTDTLGPFGPGERVTIDVELPINSPAGVQC